MSQENVEVVQRAIAAINARDIDGYLDCCTEDVELRAPMAAVGGVYQGADGIRQFLADIEDAAPDFRIAVHGIETIDGDRVLAITQTSSTGRASRIPLAAAATNVYDVEEGKISRVRIFFDHQQALEAVRRAE
jgi:ketosteroid isomerase-like protein